MIYDAMLVSASNVAWIKYKIVSLHVYSQLKIDRAIYIFMVLLLYSLETEGLMEYHDVIIQFHHITSS